MDITIDQQVALDEALIPHASRLRIGKSNFRLRSDITSKGSTLQLMYDVLRLTLFYKEFLVITDVTKIYMQEFWATAIVYHHSIHFKMDNKKQEILAFLRFLGRSGEIRKLTDVNINKLHQPWRSFTAIINKCLSGKSTGYDSVRLSQAQILWGMYHKKNVDFAYLLWEDFVYQVEHNDAKNRNEMYYPRFTKNTEQFGVVLPIELTNNDIKNFEAYKEYDAVALGAAPPKTKASVRKMKSSFNTTITPPTAAGTRLSTSAKGKQPAKASKEKRVPDVPTEESDEEISWKSSDEDDDDVDEASDEDDDDDLMKELTSHKKETKDEESFDPIAKTPKNSHDEGNNDASLGLNVGSEEGHDAGDDEDELYIDVNINLEGRDSSSVSSKFIASMLNLSPDAGIDSLFGTTSQMDVPALTTMASLTLSAPTLTPPTIPTSSQVQQAPTPPTSAPSTLLQDLLNFVKVAVQIQSVRLRDKAQAENEEFLKNLDENIQKIIKEQVKEQVKVQVSKILPKIEKTVSEQLEAKVLTRSSNSSNTSYAVAADISEMELKKILIKKIESNKSIHRSDEQRNLNKALVEAYEYDKIILDTYGDIVTLKRHRDDANKDERPSAGSDQGSKRRREEKEPESTSAPKEKATKTTRKSTQGSKAQQKTTSESAPVEEPMQTTKDFEEPSHQKFKIEQDSASYARKHSTVDSDLEKQDDSRSSFNELMDTFVDYSAFLMNRLKVDTLTPELLAGPTYELMKGSCKSLVELEFFLKEVYKATTDQLDYNNPEGQQYPHNLLKPLPLIPNSRGHRVIPFDHFINNDLKYLCGGASSRKYITSITKTKAAYYGHIMWIEDLVPHIMWSQEPISYDKHALWGISHWGRKRQQFYEFAVNIESARDLGVESYQKKLNLTQPDTYRSDLKRKEAYTAYSNPRGFIYQNKDKQNRLMRINKLHKFNDGTLNDVRTALDDRLKGIRMKCLPHAIWRKSDKERAAAMIQTIDKQLKTRRIMRCLEKFVGGRLYKGDFRMLQRTI
nr:hypothetical protein [Tanacetum cinerariifolium]